MTLFLHNELLCRLSVLYALEYGYALAFRKKEMHARQKIVFSILSRHTMSIKFSNFIFPLFQLTKYPCFAFPCHEKDPSYTYRCLRYRFGAGANQSIIFYHSLSYSYLLCNITKFILTSCVISL